MNKADRAKRYLELANKLNPRASLPELYIVDAGGVADIGVAHEIATALRRLAEIEDAEPVAWVRRCGDGTYEGTLCDSYTDETKKRGACTPLYRLPGHKEPQS